jgi:hypothetical protein
MRRRLLLLVACAASVAACSVATSADRSSFSASVTPVTVAAPTGVASVGEARVDDSLAPVSLSHPSDDAKEALRLCVGDKEKLVAGMALLKSAREVPRYGWWFGNPPELDTDAPAWVVQFAGDLPRRNGGTLHDPTCVVIDGVNWMFATGGSSAADGKVEPRSDLAKPPEALLPPVQP